MKEKISYKLIFERTFNSEKPDIGNRNDIRPEDQITFLLEDTFMTREVDAVNGILITIRPFSTERSFFIKKEDITKVLRLVK